MKRVADELERDSKRLKRDHFSVDLFSDPSQEKSATDLLTWTSSDAGYITGKIFMRWPPLTKQRIILENFSFLDGTKRFEVEFSGRCVEALRNAGLEFKVLQEMHLSLRGAELVMKKGSASNTLPVVLKYTEDVALEILPKGQGPKIDTFFSEFDYSYPTITIVYAAGCVVLTPKETSRPTLVINKGDLMDIDEEPSIAALSPSPSEKSASRSTIAATKFPAPLSTASPLHSIGNSLPAVIPPRQPALNPPISSPPPSRPARPTAALTNVIHPPASSTPKENPPTRKDSSSGPPKIPRPSNMSENHTSTSKLAGRPPAVEALQPRHRSRSLESESCGHTPDPQVQPLDTTVAEMTEGPEPVLSKKQRKNKMRKEKKKAKANLPLPGAIPSIPAASTTPDPPGANPPSTHAERTPPNDPTSSTVAAPIPQSHHQPRPPSPRLDMTTTTESDPTAAYRHQIPQGFTLLSDVKEPNKLYSIIGVVTYIAPATPTKNGDWSSSLRIVDPSNCIESFPPAREGFRVNCFTKEYAQWLPAANDGDIVILSNIKTQDRHGEVTAVGYNDKLRWAVYDPLKGTVAHGDLAGVPQSRGLDNGYGVAFSPFYKATAAVSAYCITVNDWWRSVKAKREEELGTVNQIGGARSYQPSSRREHKLLSDITADDTGNYFDCTVEVLRGHQPSSDNFQPYSLYVTDYTSLEGGYGYHQQDWCPPKLADHILRIEMWDGARSYGPDMVPGEVYYLKNVRAMTNRTGFREAKIVERKIQKLKPSDADAFPHLKALLERKEAFGLLDEVLDSKLTLIEKGNARDHITCVVELLHVEESKRLIYVTDYTCHEQIPAINEPWARGLDGRVLKVLMDDDQAAMIQRLVIGQCYQILHMKFQQSVTETEFRGRIGGSARLIHPISPRSSSVASEWKENLIERKNELKRRTKPLTERAPLTVPNLPPANEVPPASNRHTCVSIKEGLSMECPTFCVRARVIDFFPFRLEDSFVQKCTNCNKIIPETRLACFQCNDVDHNHVQIVCVLRVLISDGNDELKLSISGNVPLLADLKPVVLRNDPDASRAFSERLKPLLNNLIEAHEAILMKQVKEPNGPVGTFIIDRWKDKDGKVVYGLRNYEL
ncbi:hypothetical protein FB451DRAFT_1562758 [Mycena latifolia]|nr:hypothetical protein FB451DRAFT_1562758 [Mycena latifolia]